MVSKTIGEGSIPSVPDMVIFAFKYKIFGYISVDSFLYLKLIINTTYSKIFFSL